MIFVSVGFHNQGFERLIKKMDEIAGKIDEKVIMQIGHTNYTPKNAEFFRFKDSDEDIKYLCHEARVVVTHGGMSIMTALEQGTPVVAVPRLKKYGEHTNDHQIDIINQLIKENKITAVYDVDQIEDKLNNAGTILDAISMNNGQIVSFLRNWIQKLVL
ncbi:glycosyltransferase [Methanosarcina siciliae]|uniref:glycosyltransferase n=1 Tax=Methanosarcina siciliae TaxID=38027 RepID=UPI00064EE7FE|nr:glycosyltransferase [Methanosarcina siciliae]